MKNIRHQDTVCTGFTLTEILIAVVLITISLTVAFGMITHSMVVHQRNVYRDIAMNAARNQIEKIKATPPEIVSNPV